MVDDELARTERARDALAAELLGRPEVVMVDIGRNEAADQLVLRVHVRGQPDALAAEIPADVGGIPVRVVSGDYRPE